MTAGDRSQAAAPGADPKPPRRQASPGSPVGPGAVQPTADLAGGSGEPRTAGPGRGRTHSAEASDASGSSPAAGRGEARQPPPRKGPIPPTRRNIAAALSYLPPDLDRETWVKLGMAIKDALGDEGFEAFDGWTRGGETYHQADCRSAWKSFTPGGATTIATLWRLALDAGWKPDSEAHQETESERLAREAWHTERRAAEAKEKARKARAAKAKASRLWEAASPARADHPYLKAKGIQPVPALREAPIEQVIRDLGYAPTCDEAPLQGRVLLVPVSTGDTLTTLELIDEDGRKSAIAGGTKAGGMWAAQPLPDGDGTRLTLVLGEGVATVATAGAATGFPTVAALSAGNLPKAAKALRGRYPAARLIVLGDIGNGLKFAEQAARDSGAALAVPEFAGAQREAFQARRGQPPTDFNDLAALAGPEAVARQIAAATQVAASPPYCGARLRYSGRRRARIPFVRSGERPATACRAWQPRATIPCLFSTRWGP